MPAALTRTDAAYRALRTDILGGHFAPGTSLPFAMLGKRYGASIGVLREALTRLSAEGLVSNQAQHGFRVVPLSLEDLADLTHARCQIEAHVLADSVRHGDLAWEASIIAAHHTMEGTAKADPTGAAPVSSAWAEAHQAFHTALCSASRSRRLQEIAGSLRASAELYRRWSMPLEDPKRDVSAEHRAILARCLARDAEGAADALIDHLRLTEEILVAFAEASLHRGVDP